jgi:hypothetical protein
MAEGRTSWLSPTLGGVAGDTALLPHWLGAAAIALLSPLIDAPLAARLAFAAAAGAGAAADLGRHLPPGADRRRAAPALCLRRRGRPGRLRASRGRCRGAGADGHAGPAAARPRDHARTGPAGQRRPLRLRAGRGALPALAAAAGGNGRAAPAGRQRGAGDGPGDGPGRRRGLPPFQLPRGAGFQCAGCWPPPRWRRAGRSCSVPGTGGPACRRRRTSITIPRQWLWFLWPAWPLALWTLWRWRHFLRNRHLSVPLVVVATALLANLAMAGSDRALMLGLPGAGGAGGLCAAHAAAQRLGGHRLVLDVLLHRRRHHHLGALQRHADRRAGQAGGQHRALAPGFVASFSPLALAAAVVGTLAWLWLLRWRTGRHREALWKSLVLPAGGVALCWLLTMTLLLPPLDYARSNRALVERIAQHVPPRPASPHRAPRPRWWPHSSIWAAGASTPARRRRGRLRPTCCA